MVADMENISVDLEPDRRGRIFDREFLLYREPSQGPGWYVFGRDRNSEVIRLVARPNVAPRKLPTYNVKVRRGWRTLKEARKALEYMNSMHLFKDIERWDSMDTYGPMREGGFLDLGSVKLRKGFVIVKTDELDAILLELNTLRKEKRNGPETSA